MPRVVKQMYYTRFSFSGDMTFIYSSCLKCHFCNIHLEHGGFKIFIYETLGYANILDVQVSTCRLYLQVLVYTKLYIVIIRILR